MLPACRPVAPLTSGGDPDLSALSIAPPQERAVEEADDAPLVLRPVGVDAAGVLRPLDLPERLRLTGGREVPRLPRALAAQAWIGVDQEHRARRDLADAIDDVRRGPLVREDRRRRRHDIRQRLQEQTLRRGDA